MMDLFRETFVGTILNLVSHGHIAAYTEETPGFRAPEHFYPGWQAAHPEVHQYPAVPNGEREGDRPSTCSGSSGSQTIISHNLGASSKQEYLKAQNEKLPNETNIRAPLEDPRTSTQPSAPGTDTALSTTEKGFDPNLVEWYTPHDPENPRNWSSAKKAFVTSQLCLLTFSIYIGSSIYTAGLMDLTRQFGISDVAGILGLTLFVVGYGVGPMLLAPLSEIPALGRNLIYIITLFIFVCLQVPTALATNLGSLLPLRFLAGFIGSPVLATGGASLADMYTPAKRAYAIGIWGIAAVCGPVLGPLLGGFAAQAESWRWPIWILLWLSGGALAILVFTLPETSAAHILVKRARRLRRITGNKNLRTEGELEQAHMTGREIVMMTLVRPFVLTVKEPIVFFMNLYIALVYGLLYLWFEAFPIVFVGIYGFNLGEEGLAFLGIFVGTVISYIGFCLYCYYYLEKQFEDGGMYIVPEKRLPPACIGGLFIPICIFWFGWTSQASIPWIVPIIGSGFFGIGTFLLFQAILNYLGDAYPRYQASVLAGNDFFRASFGAAFPLFANAMFKNLGGGGGVGWGSSLIGFLSLAMVPIPWVLWKYGGRIRKLSKYAD